MFLRSLWLIAVAGSLLLPLPASAQRGGPAAPAAAAPMRMGTIRGQLRMPDGRTAPLGIVVRLSYREGGMVTQTQTDRSGKFSFDQLSPAIYRIQIRAPGYRDIETNDLDLNLSLMQYLNFDLQPEPNYVGAPTSVAKSSESVPDDAREFLESGQKLLERGSDYGKSIEWFKKAIKVYPKYSEAYLMMGLAYRAQPNHLDDASTALRKCIEIDGNSAPAYIALGEIQNQQQAYADAERTLQKAVTLVPDSAPARVELARTYWALGRWQDAEPQASKALSLAPENASAHLIMGNVDLRKRDGAGALKHFQEYLRLDPQGPMAPGVRDMVGKLEKALASSSPAKP